MINTGRNINLHPAFEAPWLQPDFSPEVVVPQGNTSFDPFLGTGWGEFLDAAGAKSPEGASINPSRQLSRSPQPLSMQGLSSVARPSATVSPRVKR